MRRIKKSVIIIPALFIIAILGICAGVFKKDLVKTSDNIDESISIEQDLEKDGEAMEAGKESFSESAPREAKEGLSLSDKLKNSREFVPDLDDRESLVASAELYPSEASKDVALEDGDIAAAEGDFADEDEMQNEVVDISYGSTNGGAPSISPVAWNPAWLYGDRSRIHTGSGVLYKVSDTAPTIAVNAGHGTRGGSSVKTLCHPDGTPKVTGGSTSSGSVSAIAVSAGATMKDGTPEAAVTLKLAYKVKDALIAKGYNVLMVRDGEDVQLDNVARTVMANNMAQAHISLHYDSTESNKGFFYIGVPDVASYRAMEPVASHYMEHQRLGESILAGMKAAGAKIYGSGQMALDLTQTSYSTIPSVDLEVGDRGSDYSDGSLRILANGIVEGMGVFFGR